VYNMPELSSQGEFQMQIDPQLIEAARRTVAEKVVGDVAVEIIGYEGMFVSEEDKGGLKEIHFFAAGDKKFAIGVKRK